MTALTTLPPRALSIRPDDPSYRPDAIVIGGRIDILLGGTRLTKVVAYDCDAGWARRYETDPDDRIVLVATRDAAAEEVVLGDIAVRWKAAA